MLFMSDNKKYKACFLDRDGVVNVEKSYVHKLEDLIVYEETYEAVKLLKDNAYKVIVITNQGGVAKGYYKESDIHAVHKEIDRLLNIRALSIDAYYYCLHHPEGSIKEYTLDCECRKPAPGMIFQAAEDFNIDLSLSFMIGDKMSDIKAARKAGCTGILVETGHGLEHRDKAISKSIIVKKNILEAVKYYLFQRTD